MQVVTLDFETYWDTDYSVSKMSPLEYVMGDRYETISCSVKVDDGETRVFFGDEVGEHLDTIDWSTSAALAHNMSGFDAYIAAYRYGIRPKVWLDTAAMARPLHAKTIGVSLSKLVRHYQVGVKNDAILHATKGKRLADFTADEIEQMRVYNKADTDQCYALFKILRLIVPPKELWQIDLVTRMRTEPRFVLDEPLLTKTLAEEVAAKREAMLDLARMLTGITPDLSDVMSDDAVVEMVRAEVASPNKFAELLHRLDVAVPMKPSPSDPDSGKLVPALAKTDDAFVDLQEHENPIVQMAARTRLAVKSTLLETRISKLLTAAQLAGGALPVPVRYAGADTTGRDSGEEYNMYNLPRVDPRKPKRTDALRNSLRAPAGHKVVVADLSNIELRVNHTLWRVKRSMAMWKANPVADLYRASAAARYGVEEDQVDTMQRFQAKVEELGLGFGAGSEKFRFVAKVLSGGAIDLSRTFRYATEAEVATHPDFEWPLDKDGFAIVVESDPAAESVAAWRARYPEIVRGWEVCNAALPVIFGGAERTVDSWGFIKTCPEGLQLPGYTIRYPHLRRELNASSGRDEWVYGEGRHRAKIYGAKVNENVVQSLARQIIVDNTIEVFRRTKQRPALRPYDELAYIVPEEEAEALLATVLEVMRTPPAWWPELTVWAEGDVADTYGAAK